MNAVKIFLVVITFLPLPSVAINKCVDDGGKVFYTDLPCPVTAKSAKQLNIVDNAIVEGGARRETIQPEGIRGADREKADLAVKEDGERLGDVRLEACKKALQEPKKEGDVTAAIKVCRSLKYSQPTSQETTQALRELRIYACNQAVRDFEGVGGKRRASAVCEALNDLY